MAGTSGSIHDIQLHDNFTDNAAKDFKARNSTDTNNQVFATEQWPPPALDIIAHAGLEAAYKNLLTRKDPVATAGSSH